jgi:hypothetical protein
MPAASAITVTATNAPKSSPAELPVAIASKHADCLATIFLDKPFSGFGALQAGPIRVCGMKGLIEKPEGCRKVCSGRTSISPISKA